MVLTINRANNIAQCAWITIHTAVCMKHTVLPTVHLCNAHGSLCTSVCNAHGSLCTRAMRTNHITLV
jgi:hypothetical protein